VIRVACLALLLGVISLPAQPPAIGQNGVVNTASQIPPTLAGGALSQGSLFTIYGVRFGSSESSTQVKLQHGRITTAAKVISVGPRRIDAWLPSSVPSGPALLTVDVNGQESEEFKVEVVEANPGLFSRNGEGWGPGLIRNLRANGPGASNGENNPAHPNQRVSLLGTGFGQARKVTVVVGNRAVQAGPARSTSQLGQQEIRFSIPADAPVGCYVPVYVLAAPRRASNVVTVSIRSGNAPCDPGLLPLLSADRVGVALFARSQMRALRANVDIISDEAIVAFSAHSAGPVLSPLLLLPPAGVCTAYTSSFQANTILPNSISAAIVAEVGAHGLGAGSALTLTNGQESRTIPQDGGTFGYYRAQLGNSDARRRRPLFLEPGELTLSGTGGPDVGAFSWMTRTADRFEWIDREAISRVNRDRPLTVHWSGLAGDRTALILATNVDKITTAIGTTLCAAPAAAGQFTIPAEMLADLPESKDIAGAPYDQLFVISMPLKTAPLIQARGIDGGALISVHAIGRFVEYR
jgi:uncharacterized protein (TIGR03437 family)